MRGWKEVFAERNGTSAKTKVTKLNYAPSGDWSVFRIHFPFPRMKNANFRLMERLKTPQQGGWWKEECLNIFNRFLGMSEEPPFLITFCFDRSIATVQYSVWIVDMRAMNSAQGALLGLELGRAL